MTTPLPLPPSNFRYMADTRTLHWDPPVGGAEEYEIRYKEPPTGDWIKIYQGSNTFCPFEMPPGTYNADGRSRNRGDWGDYGPPGIVFVP